MLVANELVRLQSVDRGEWLTCGYADDGSNHPIFTVEREKLQEKAALSEFDKDSSLCWDNAGFVIRLVGTDEAGQQLVRLDAGRFVENYMYVDIAKSKATTNGGTPVQALAWSALKKRGADVQTVFVVEREEATEGGALLRLRCMDSPGTYVYAASIPSKISKGFSAHYFRHAVLAAPREQAGVWEAAAFRVTQEGVEAAAAQDKVAAQEERLRKLWIKRLLEFFQGLFGIIELGIIASKQCPGVPALPGLLLALSVAFIADPAWSILMMCLTDEALRETGRMPRWARAADGLVKLGELGLSLAVVALAWPAGYLPLGLGSYHSTYDAAAAAWNATHWSATEPPGAPPAELPYCDGEIVFMAFLGPLLLLVVAALALLVGGLRLLEWLDEWDKRDKAARAARVGAAGADQGPAAGADSGAAQA